MNTFNKMMDDLNEEDVLIYTFLGVAFILGAYVRVQFISHTDYPLNDGGFFYQMTEDLIGNGFRLPFYSSYNEAGIPYAYPPLAFYLLGALNKGLNLSLLSLFRFLPGVISILTLWAFYIFSNEFIDHKVLRVIAVYLFAMLPRSFEWFVMGGGVTRSLGFFFSLLAIKYISQLFNNEKVSYQNLFLAALFSGLTILSHPVTSLFLVFGALLFFIFNERKIENVNRSVLLSGFVLLITLPWWASIISRHGLDPFLDAGGTGHLNWFEIKNILTLKFGFENPFFLTIYGVFALIGGFFVLNKQTAHLVVAIVLGYIVMPRGGVDLLSSYMSLLTTVGLYAVLVRLMIGKKVDNPRGLTGILVDNTRSRLFLSFILLYVFIGAYTYKYSHGRLNLHLTHSDDLAVRWIQKNADMDANFLVYPSRGERSFWWNDFRAEWLPALSNRESVTTVQGYEWHEDSFSQRVSRYVELYFCAQNGPSCVEEWKYKHDIRVDYIYIGNPEDKFELVEDFHRNDNYVAVYENDEIIIFQNNMSK